MTWYYEIHPEGPTISVYDHTGSIVLEGAEYSDWVDRRPKIVLETMYDAALDAYEAGNEEYTIRTLADAIFNRIEPGTPDSN